MPDREPQLSATNHLAHRTERARRRARRTRRAQEWRPRPRPRPRPWTRPRAMPAFDWQNGRGQPPQILAWRSVLTQHENELEYLNERLSKLLDEAVIKLMLGVPRAARKAGGRLKGREHVKTRPEATPWNGMESLFLILLLNHSS